MGDDESNEDCNHSRGGKGSLLGCGAIAVSIAYASQILDGLELRQWSDSAERDNNVVLLLLPLLSESDNTKVLNVSELPPLGRALGLPLPLYGLLWDL